MPAAPAIGVDLGGTKIEVLALTGGADDQELLRKRVPTPRDDYAATVAAIAALVRDAEAALSDAGLDGDGPPPVGVGHPGSRSASGGWRNANSTWLNGQTLDSDIMAAVGRPMAFANDANCLALSEARDGAAAGCQNVFAVIIGTGCGGGLVIGGELHAGAFGLAGEWGHIPLPWMTADEFPGPTCWCGKRGCIETFLSGPGFAANAAGLFGDQVPATEIARRAANGDPTAAAALATYIDRLGRALAMVINLVDPDVIVLGGGVSNIEALYEEVPKVWQRYLFGGEGTKRLVRAQHGDSSGVRGAAWLARAMAN